MCLKATDYPNPDGRGESSIGAEHLPGLGRDVIARRIETEYHRFPALKTRRQILGGSLSGGERQMLAVSRGMMMAPKLLMLTRHRWAWLRRHLQRILAALGELAKSGMAVLMVEQKTSALQIADRAYVLKTGPLFITPRPQTFASDVGCVPALYELMRPARLLRDPFTAVDVERLAGDDPRPRRGEEHHRVRDVVLRRDQAERDAGLEIGALLWCIHNAAGQRCVDKRGTNAVDPDPMRRKLDCQRLGQAFHGVFGHAVDGAIGGSDMAHLG